MSFIPFIRDYIELLNTVYVSLSNEITQQKIIQETILYLAGTIKFILIYIFSFQWFRDFFYLPILIPKLSNSILKETFFLETPLENIFNILEIPTYNTNKFFIGILNSFFLALPITSAHLIFVRRLLIQGSLAGIAAGVGNILGQLFFIASVIFGFRFFIISWFFFEPLNYFFGFILLLMILYDMAHERVIKVVDWSNKLTIFKIFCLNFLLIWTEQTCFFQFIGNLTFDANSSVLESFYTKNNSNFFLTHFPYLIGLLFGSIFFNTFFALFIRKITNFLQIKFTLLKSTWIIRVNSFLLILTLIFTFTSIPFYGIDFLLTKSLGFISQDIAFKNTFFSQNELKDPFQLLASTPDVTPFDRGFYLTNPNNQTFEELNYSGEYAVNARHGFAVAFEEYGKKLKKLENQTFTENNLKNNNENSSSLDFNDLKVNSESVDENKKVNRPQTEQGQKDTANLIFNDLGNKYEFSSTNYKALALLSEAESNPVNMGTYTKSKNFDNSNDFLDNLNYRPDIELDYLNTEFSDTSRVIFDSAELDQEKNRKENLEKRYMKTYKKRLNMGFDEIIEDSLNNIFFLEKVYSLNTEKHKKLERLDIKLKEKYYANPIYQFLVNTDIDNFLNRQQKKNLLSPTEEKELYKKRLILEKYNDSLRFYNTLSYADDFQNLFNGSKSFSDRVYNQQFKGTLFIVRRLFSISLNLNDKNSEEFVVKYDQPLYNYSKNRQKFIENPIHHEELKESSYLTNYQDIKKSPLVELVWQSPLYFGWDEDLRKIFLTNRLLTKSITNFSEPLPTLSSFSNYKRESKTPVKAIEFTTWPINQNQINNQEIPSKLLFETTTRLEKLENSSELLPFFLYDDEEVGVVTYDSLPNNIIKFISDSIDILPPNRGGFIWPGTANLKFSINKVFKNWHPKFF